MKQTILFIGFIGLCTILSAQKPLSLEEYRQRVIAYNQQIKAAKESTIAAEAKRNIVRVGFLPKIDAQGQYAFTNKIVFMEPLSLKQHNYNFGGTVSQPIYTGGELQARYTAAKIEKEIAIFNEQYTLDQVIYNADMVYWTAAANEQFLNSTTKFYNSVDSLYAIIKIRFDDGLISRTDLLQVQTRLKEAEQQLINARKEYEIAAQNLNIMMGEAPNLDYRTADSIGQIVSIPEERTIEAVLLARPDFSIAEKQILLQKQNVKAAVAKFNPQLAIGGSAQWGTKQINIDGSTMWIANGFAQLSVPVFHWGERKYTKRAATAAVSIKQYEMELQRDNIQRELSKAWSEIQQLSKQLVVANENLDIAYENLDINTFSYTEGRLTVLDVLQAQMSWVQAFTSLIQTNYGFKAAVADYERITSIHSNQ